MNAKWICPAGTPLHGDGTLDFDSTARLYHQLARCGLDGVLVGGSLGEFFSQPIAQRESLARFAIEQLAGRMPVIVGTASMLTEEIAPFSNRCLEAGASAVMIVPPYYFALGDEPLFAYFDRLAQEIRGPVYLYNFPDRTGYSISPAVVQRLALRHNNIVGIKDTLAGMDHTRALIRAVKPLRPEFEVYSGFDDNFAHNVLSGGDGCVSGFSNISPAFCAGWKQAVQAGDMAACAAAQQKMDQYMGIYSLGAPFIPYVKEACRQMGWIDTAVCTFPLPTPDAAAQEAVRRFLSEGGLPG